MASNEEYDKLLDHDYDGIKEYDNPLPGWWTYTFWASIIFSVLYVMYFHIGTGLSVEEKYQEEVTASIVRQLDMLGDIQPDNKTIIEFMNKPDWMEAMGGMFRGNCAQCHARDGGGNVGPNLCDDMYKSVKSPEDIFRVIRDGVPNTQMAAWGDRLREPQIILLAAYVATLRGTTPAVAKEAEGSEIAAWPTLDDVQADDVDGEADTSSDNADEPST